MRKNQLFCWIVAAIVALCNGSALAQLSDVTQPGDPIVASSNNSPGSEGVANAIDNQPTKYLNFDRLNTGFTVSPRVGLSVVQCLSLTSANDAPERDPASYTLEGSYDGTNFTMISSGPVPAFAARFDKVVVRFENNTPYLIYRVMFPTVVGPGGNSMQIAEVELLGFLAPTDVTQPSDPIVASSNNSPGSEGVRNAIDNQPTKYLNFDRLNTGFTVTPAVGGTLVSGLTLTSANDAPERDPASYTLEGSLDGTTFFPIASGPVAPFPTRFYKNYIFFPNDRAFRAYRLIFPTVLGPGGNSMQIAEVELLGDVADIAQDVTLPGDPIIGTSNNTPGSEGVANAIDNQPTKYLNFDRLNTGFTVNPGVRGLTVVSGLTLTSANDAPERDPADYVLSGSYDGTNFTQIAAGSVAPFTARFQKQTILFDNNVPYLQYRLVFPNVAGPGGNSMQISEVELLGVLADTDVTTPGDPIVGTSNNTPGSEGVANAIDNQPTKYLNFDRLNTGFTVTPRVGGTILSGLSLTSANDAPERDPASYTLEGSNDGQEYVMISQGSVAPFPTRFHKNYIFFPDNTKEFTSYRLIFPTVVGPGGNSMQIAEVELLGHQRGGGSCTIETNGMLIRVQPRDTPVLEGATASLRVQLTGPWKVQWFRNGVAIPGANNAIYTTPPASVGDDGAVYYAKVGPATVGGVRGLCETSDEVMLNLFTPSSVASIGLSWVGGGANGAPTEMLPNDITGLHQQAHWNNLVGGSGSLVNPTNSNNQLDPTITVTWQTSGEWGAGTGEGDPTERMLNGMVTTFSTTESAAQSVVFSGVPPGNHSLILYTVQVPLEFFNVDFVVTTHNEGGDVVQRRYIRPQNADEYNPLPIFSLVTADDPSERQVGNTIRIDNIEPGLDGIIEVKFYAPGRIDLPGGDPIRGPGLNAMQLVLDAPAGAQAPEITQQPASANTIAGSCFTLEVQATGSDLTYQWYKNSQPIAGATGPRLTLQNVQASDAGLYAVVVSNPGGQVLSRLAVVEVLSSTAITHQLITHLKFDEDAGETADNSAPGGQDGAVNGIALWSPGQIGNSLLLEQAFDNYVLVPSYPKAPRLSVAGWVLANTDQWGPIINNWVEGRTTGQSGQFQIQVVPDPVLGTVLRAQIEVGPNRAQAEAVIDGTPGVFHHFAMTANGRTLSLYWDGRLVAAVDYLGSINAPASPAWLSIGANLNETTPPPTVLPPTFAGVVDDFGLWSRNLSENEIQAIYNAGLAGQSLSQVAPVITVGNCPPLANDDAAATAVNTAVTVSVLANDSDPNGDPLTVASRTLPDHGTNVINGDGTITYTPDSGYSGPDSFTYTISDGQGGSDTAVVRINVGAPVTCPANVTAGTDAGQCSAIVTFTATGADSCTPASGSAFAVGTTTVTCTGSGGQCTFTVTVRDDDAPAITCPADIVAECEGGQTPATYSATATDNCDQSVTVTCVPPSGSAFGLGSSSVTCTATDDAGNASTCTFTVTVRDSTPPILTCSPNLEVPPTSPNGATVTYVAGATDPCGIGSFNCTPPSGSTFPLGTTTVTCTAVNASGGSASCNFTVTVRNPNDPPTCAAVVEPEECLLTFGTDPRQYVLALDNATACIVLSGLGSTDPNGDALTFTWVIDGATTLTGPLVNVCLEAGCHTVELSVTDGQDTTTCRIEVCVIGPGEALEECINLVDTTDLGRKNKRPLIASLKAAQASFDRGNLISGRNQLEAFQNKVAAQVARENPAAAAAFIECVQRILDAINCAAETELNQP